jgi:hypothetical protein
LVYDSYNDGHCHTERVDVGVVGVAQHNVADAHRESIRRHIADAKTETNDVNNFSTICKHEQIAITITRICTPANRRRQSRRISSRFASSSASTTAY